jgi:hypothetical protein
MHPLAHIPLCMLHVGDARILWTLTRLYTASNSIKYLTLQHLAFTLLGDELKGLMIATAHTIPDLSVTINLSVCLSTV